jgi:hypothetical protein
MEPRRGRPKKQELIVSEEQRSELRRLAAQARSSRAVAFRARIILGCASGLSNAAVAARLRTTGFTVGFWRSRFIGDEKIEQVVRLTLEKTPKGATHWSSRMLAGRTGLSQSTISRIWRAFGLKPHRSESFQLSRDPLLVEKVRDIVGLYMEPPHHALVLCVDEKSQIQALDRTQPLLPLQPGQVERGTHDYKRNGTTSLFAALDLKTSRVIGQLHHRHRSVEFRRFLDLIEDQVPAGLDVHIIVDNYSTHKTAVIRRWFAKRPRFHVHFTPTYGSWINLVERWFAELTNKRIRRGVFRSVKELESAIREYIDVHNEDPTPFVWTKTADQILASIARYAQRTTAAHAN